MAMTWMHGRRRRVIGGSDDGNVTVEFALIGTLFFVLVGIAIQGAILFNAWLVISNAVEEGARYGAPCYNRSVQSCSAQQVQNAVLQAAPVDQSQMTVNVTSSSGLLTVSASYNVALVVPFVSTFLANPTTVIADSSMRLENGGS